MSRYSMWDHRNHGTIPPSMQNLRGKQRSVLSLARRRAREAAREQWAAYLAAQQTEVA